MTHAKPLPTFPRDLTQQTSASAEPALTLLGPSAAMGQLWTQIRRLAPYFRTVLLTGEVDCGQEAVARLLLDLSSQNHRSLLVLDAAELERRLLRATGLISLPSDIVLFLPDVHALSLTAQDNLLRLLRVRRSRLLTVIAATSEDLRSLVSVGRFSSELADLLSAVRLALPSLKQRTEDLPMLISHLLATHSACIGRSVPHTGEDFLRAAMQHAWPENLRELSRILHALCSAKDLEALHAADLHRALAEHQPAPAHIAAPTRMVSLDTVMNEHILGVLRACHGNKLRAAETLGISRSTLYRMLDAASATQPTPMLMAS